MTLGLFWSTKTLDFYQKIVCKKEKHPLWILGQKYSEVQKNNTAANIVCFDTIKRFAEKVKTLND